MNIAKSKSAFADKGLKKEIKARLDEIKEIYLSDDFPWIIGYSGGKDSTATLQLIWVAISELPEGKRNKAIHIISTDTLVENPIVAQWVTHSLSKMESVSKEQSLPFRPHRLTPTVQDSFWVNLIGKGYPTPRPKFRWCTSRLKINPSNKFITDLLKEYGETTLVLGTRHSESSARSANMKKHIDETKSQAGDDERYETISTDARKERVINGNIPGSWVYTPISHWTDDDVWIYTQQVANPWGHRNVDLLTMYQGATAGGECPLVVDSSTPSCGDSRFGCYVCTMVEQDKSMAAMIQNDDEKNWMLPLMEFRNKWLVPKEDRKYRDYRRMNGSLMIFNDRLVKGPYRQSFREHLLKELLTAQKQVDDSAPEDVQGLELINFEELEEIRHIWVQEKLEIEDRLPNIYEDALGQAYPGENIDENQIFSEEQLELLQQVCKELGDQDGYRYETLRSMLVTESQFSSQLKRVGIYTQLWSSLKRGVFEGEEQAEEFARSRKEAIDQISEEDIFYQEEFGEPA